MQKAGIILLNWNGKEYLEECLSSLRKQNYPEENYKIILVDNGSTDGSVKFVQENYPVVDVILNHKNLGFAEGNNVGMRYALKEDFEYIVLLNQDTACDKNWLKELVAVAEQDQKIGAVQSLIFLYDNKELINTSGNKLHYLGFGYVGDYKLPGTCRGSEVSPARAGEQIGYASGASVLYRASSLKEIGLFDPEFFAYHEDLDLSWRLGLAGYKIVLAPKSIVYHKYSFSRNPKKYYWIEKNRWITILSNYEIKTLIILSPVLLLTEIGMLFYSLISGWFLWKIKSYDFLFKLDYVLQRRKKIQNFRRVNDQEIIKYFTHKIEFEELKNKSLINIGNQILGLYWLFAKFLIG